VSEQRYREVLDQIVRDSCAALGVPQGYTTAPNGPTTFDAPTVEELVQTGQQFAAQIRAADDNFAAAFLAYFRRSTVTLTGWAERFGVSVLELYDVLDGTTRPIPAWFYDRARAVFAPLIPAPIPPAKQ